LAAARAIGADVPVCVDPRPRLMRGIGDVLSGPLAPPRLPAVLVNPGVAVVTREVFGRLRIGAGMRPWALDLGALALLRTREQWLDVLRAQANDLEDAAIALAPAVADVLAALRALPRCRLARMSGSGATCFGLFNSAREAAAAARLLQADHPHWWVRASALG
jgi:4-diphosphocytidyl-2-C-methyl-D-erythritol kinase